MSNLLETACLFRPIESSGAPPGLPVYILKQSSNSIFYTPGLVAVVTNELAGDLQDFLLVDTPDHPANELVTLGSLMRQQALHAICEYRKFYEGPFEPKCLTLYLQNQCNLDCDYCLGFRVRKDSTKLNPETVRASAEMVAQNCWKRSVPFTVVFHGWGEPTYDFQLLQSLWNIVEGVARDSHVKPLRYIATNAVVSGKIAEYLSGHFEFVGISCDGPPEIQDHMRRTASSGMTSALVEQTAAILKNKGTRFSVRATITSYNVTKQEEIADYILKSLQPNEIYFEPAYRVPHHLRMNDAAIFLEHFEKASSLAHAAGVPLTFSGSRFGEIHGPYCNVYRNVLNLIPDGSSTACFVENSENPTYRISKPHAIAIDSGKVKLLQSALSRVPKQCLRCFNHFHCVGTCPDECILSSYNKDPTDSFRCRLQLFSTFHQIMKLANEMEIDARPFSWREVKGREHQ